MNSFIEFVQNNISVFDLISFLILLYTIAECGAKGFMKSLFSFSKWLLALIITIILVPKLNPWIQDFIESNTDLHGLISGFSSTLRSAQKIVFKYFFKVQKYKLSLENLKK